MSIKNVKEIRQKQFDAFKDLEAVIYITKHESIVHRSRMFWCCSLDTSMTLMTLILKWKYKLEVERIGNCMKLEPFVKNLAESWTLPVFHSFSGTDTTFAFMGRGKNTAWPTWEPFGEVTDACLFMVNNPVSAGAAHFKTLIQFCCMTDEQKQIMWMKHVDGCSQRKTDHLTIQVSWLLLTQSKYFTIRLQIWKLYLGWGISRYTWTPKSCYQQIGVTVFRI